MGEHTLRYRALNRGQPSRARRFVGHGVAAQARGASLRWVLARWGERYSVAAQARGASLRWVLASLGERYGVAAQARGARAGC